MQKSEAARRKSLEEEVREKMGLITRLRGEREDLQYRIDQKKTGPPASKVCCGLCLLQKPTNIRSIEGGTGFQDYFVFHTSSKQKA